MQTLSDRTGKTVGYLYNNVILLPGHVVSGVLLAHCVFTKSGGVKGKFFNEYLYSEQGAIIAQLGKSEAVEITADLAKQLMIDAWKILALTKEHLCPWVVATDKWGRMSLKDFLDQ